MKKTLVVFLTFSLPIFLFYSCSDAKSKSGNRDFEKSKKAYIKSYAGTEKEKEAINGLITSSLNFEEARYAYEAAVKTKLPSETRRAIGRMGRYASTSEEMEETKMAKEKLLPEASSEDEER